MNIIGEKVILRAIEDTDCELLRSLFNNPDNEYMLGGWSFPISQQQQKSWYNNLPVSQSILRVMIDVDGKPIGTAILSDIDYKNGHAEIHIKLIDGDYRGKGYGTDTINTLVRYAFNELRLHSVYARVNKNNQVSQKLFAKCGFIEEGLLRHRIFKRGEYIDVISFSLINPAAI